METPFGTDFDAVVNFRERVKDMDKYYVYQMNGCDMNDTVAYVFKSCTSMAEMTVEMDQSTEGFMRDEHAYVDAKHDRCQNYRTITLWTYHPTMRRILRLAVMDVEKENTEGLTILCITFNRMLQDHTGKDNYMFNPVGFVCDEHHANFRSIQAVFGDDVLPRVKTCEFHYKHCVQRHSRCIEQQLRPQF